MSAADDPDIILARLGAIVDSSDDAIVSKTLDGIITSWNPAATRMFGYTASEAIGRHITLIVPEDRHGEEAEVLARLRRGERVDHFETVRQTKDGRLINISLTVSPLRGPTGTIIGASKIARDVTERMRAEVERAKLLNDAQAANRAKDDFLAMLGHELRNPLAAVASAAYVIATARTLDEVSRPLAVITRQVGHVRRLIEDLLDAARVRTGKIALDRQPVNLREAVEHAVTVVRAGPVPIRHVIEVDADDVGTLADPTRLEQIILNLLTNAVKYTPAGRRIRVTARAEEGQAVLRVADEGVGMSAEAIETIFDLFVQGEQAVDRAQGGLGIGLTLVRALVELHGGSVEAASDGIGCGQHTHGPAAGDVATTRRPLARRHAPNAAEARLDRRGQRGLQRDAAHLPGASGARGLRGQRRRRGSADGLTGPARGRPRRPGVAEPRRPRGGAPHPAPAPPTAAPRRADGIRPAGRSAAVLGRRLRLPPGEADRSHAAARPARALTKRILIPAGGVPRAMGGRGP
jgi:PAS domain S-box-containing protein